MFRTSKHRRARALFTNCILLICTLATASYCTPRQARNTTPTLNHGEKWRIGFYEGGPWRDYQDELLALVSGLIELGWIQPVDFPEWSDEEDTRLVWQWLAEDVKSDTLVFVPQAYWSAAWEDATRERNRDAAIAYLQAGKLDLILALGTWAGQDLANDLHNIPTIVMSTSNAIQAGIIPSADDSGFPHVHAKCDPAEQIREIRTFYDTVKFDRIGVIYDYATEDSRIYAALPDLESVAEEKGFAIVACDAPEYDLGLDQIAAGVYACLEELAPQIDAFYITAHNGFTIDTLPGVLQPLYDHAIPTWAQEGPGLVEHGAMLSIARIDASAVGRFEADVVARTLNGANPGDLDQIFEEPKRLAINLETARRIGYELPPGLISSADQIFDYIEGDGYTAPAVTE